MTFDKILDVVIILAFALVAWGLLIFLAFLLYVNYVGISPEMSGDEFVSTVLFGCFVFFTGFICYVTIKYVRKVLHP